MPLHDEHKPLLANRTFDSDEEEADFDSTEKVHIVGVDDADSEDWTKTPPFSWKKLWLFTGPGFLMSIAFLDPGNLEGDLQAGAIAGYSLLWLLFWATAMGLLIQLLSARLGVATGRHLAELCRDEYPKWARLLLWVMAELALIGSDIQEVIGSAIAIKILSNGAVPLWGGVVITACDCFVFLFLENFGVRKLEAVFAVLIATMAMSFAWMFVDTKPNGVELLLAAFYGTDIASSIGLANAGQYLEEKYGGGLLPILYIWAIGLLAAGQSSTLTGTYAGQFIMGGFLNLRLKKWVRALITRSFAIVPTMIVALAFESSDDSLDVLNEWLNVLQSVQIPFALIPLLCLVSNEEIMGVFKIGTVLKMVSWLVAALLMLINGYLLLEFFSSEVNGWLFVSLVSVFTAAYVAFIIYLVSRGITFSNCLGFLHSKGSTNSGN
ncbi:hypothetical protein HYC85_002396 [Camellia sinensis]|uniref:Uncharacterized protein n=1 Tax=Camellia sinensis TaxID=4442 RepID=A0A7J7I9K1_CAMSI|nr:hypothetical protein HYC85_002396 [Camellia sinensis]